MPALASSAERLARLGRALPKSLTRFVVVGLIGLATHTTLFSLLFHQAGLARSAAWLAALAVATGVTWTLNRRFTFAATGRRSPGEIARYAAVTLVAQGVSFAVFTMVGRLAPQLPAQLALITGAVVATALSYTGQRFFTFARYGSAGAGGPAEIVAVADTPLIVAAPAPEAAH